MLAFLRKDLLLILAVAAVIISMSYAIGYVTERPTIPIETQPAFLENDQAPKAQSATSRIWRPHAFEKLFTLDVAKITKPTIMQVADTGHIYVLDWADFRIKVFSVDGSLLRMFGEGNGTTAGAFTNPTSFSVASDGDVWVCDPLQHKLTHFEAEGAAQAIVPRSNVDRVAVLGDVLVTMAPPGSTSLFEIYSPSGEQLKSFGQFLQNQSQQGIILDGTIVSDAESQAFVYGGRHIGIIAGYSSDGSKHFVTHTIDGNPLPKVLHIGGTLKVKKNDAPSILSLSILKNHLYVLSGTRANDENGNGGQVMDVYDKRNGNYLFSLRLPVNCREAVVHDDRVYTQNDAGVTVWRFREST